MYSITRCQSALTSLVLHMKSSRPTPGSFFKSALWTLLFFEDAQVPFWIFRLIPWRGREYPKSQKGKVDDEGTEEGTDNGNEEENGKAKANHSYIYDFIVFRYTPWMPIVLPSYLPNGNIFTAFRAMLHTLHDVNSFSRIQTEAFLFSIMQTRISGLCESLLRRPYFYPVSQQTLMQDVQWR